MLSASFSSIFKSATLSFSGTGSSSFSDSGYHIAASHLPDNHFFENPSRILKNRRLRLHPLLGFHVAAHLPQGHTFQRHVAGIKCPCLKQPVLFAIPDILLAKECSWGFFSR